LVVRDENGEIYSVRYDAVNAMLLNEFLKEHRKTNSKNRRWGSRRRKLRVTNSKLKRLLQGSRK